MWYKILCIKTLGTRLVPTCGHALRGFMHNDLMHCENFICTWSLSFCLRLCSLVLIRAHLGFVRARSLSFVTARLCPQVRVRPLCASALFSPSLPLLLLPPCIHTYAHLLHLRCHRHCCSDAAAPAPTGDVAAVATAATAHTRVRAPPSRWPGGCAFALCLGNLTVTE
jgi:hypothetical protein